MEKVTAAIIEKEGLILLARRKRNKSGGGWLEFPGGKVLPKEAPEDCLRRELKEEFGVEAEIKESLGTWNNPGVQPGVELIVYRVSIPDVPLLLIDHEEVLWVCPQNIPLEELLPLDREIAGFLFNKA